MPFEEYNYNESYHRGPWDAVRLVAANRDGLLDGHGAHRMGMAPGGGVLLDIPAGWQRGLQLSTDGGRSSRAARQWSGRYSSRKGLRRRPLTAGEGRART